MRTEHLKREVGSLWKLYNTFKSFVTSGIKSGGLKSHACVRKWLIRDKGDIDKLLEMLLPTSGSPAEDGCLLRIQDHIERETSSLGFKLFGFAGRQRILPHKLYPRRFRELASELRNSESPNLTAMLRGIEAMPTRQKFTICHISDLHLGDFHFDDSLLAIPHVCRVLNALTVFVRKEGIRPRFLIFTGDVSSRAEKKWLEFFRDYLEALSQDGEHPIAKDRMIVLHGNHDMFRPKGKPATSNRFQGVFPGTGWNTVFSPARAGLCVPFADGECNGAVYVYPAEGFAAIALDSCRFIGSLDPDVLDASKTVKKGRYSKSARQELAEKLNTIIRIDYGTIPAQYAETGMRILRETLAGQGSTRAEWFVCGLLHHNVTEVRGIDQVLRGEYPSIVNTLLGRQDGARVDGVDCVLHGHVHKRVVVGDSGKFIAASSLGGLQTGGEEIGLSLIEVDEGYPGEHRHATCKRYKLEDFVFKHIPDADYTIPVGN